MCVPDAYGVYACVHTHVPVLITSDTHTHAHRYVKVPAKARVCVSARARARVCAKEGTRETRTRVAERVRAGVDGFEGLSAKRVCGLRASKPRRRYSTLEA